MSEAVCRVYEREEMRAVTGEALRPGGLDLTERALSLVTLPSGGSLLEVGCGPGTSAAYLMDRGDLSVFGLDLSYTMLLEAGRHAPQFERLQADGIRLPVASAAFDAVLCECALSLMSDPTAALKEFARALKPGGHLILSDMFIRQPEVIPALRAQPISCCLSRAMVREELLGAITAAGFTPLIWEDHTAALKQLTMKAIMTYGSLGAFWGCVTGAGDAEALGEIIKQSKPGYYLLIAGKGAIDG